LASQAAYCSHGGAAAGVFAGIYFVICWASIAAWAGAGHLLTAALQDHRRMRRFNAAMALLLALTALMMAAT
jgi:threonine/homoserine/homoserine lactone efflux protein